MKRIRAGYGWKNRKLKEPKAGPTHRRCPEILSVMETYRNRIENFGNIGIILIIAGLRWSETKVGFVMKIARGHAARGTRIYLDPPARNRRAISIWPRNGITAV